jgi:thiamine-phosphate pyrophosphorylase
MKLIVISRSKTSPEESKVVTDLFECGLETYHLRKPSMSTSDMCKMIEEIPEHFHNRIIIHSHHKLASKYDLRGIHLTNVHRHKKFSTWLRTKILRMSNDDLVVSTSFHKLGQLYTNKKEYSYIFMGTMFDRLSGGFHAGYNEQNVRTVIEKFNTPLLARGGVTNELLPRCNELGFAGAALASCIWDQPKPVDAWCETLRFCKEREIPFS